jgi:hypothetical protein
MVTSDRVMVANRAKIALVDAPVPLYRPGWWIAEEIEGPE